MQIIDLSGPELNSTQIRKARLLWQKLRAKADAPFVFLHNALPVKTKSQLATSEPANLEAVIAEALNHVVRGKSIYEPERFKRFNLRAETKELAADPEALNTEQIRRLNRLLLEDSLDSYLGRYLGKANPKLSILHVSDLHFRSDLNLEADSNDNVMGHFENRLSRIHSENGRKPVDLILVSGDLVDYDKVDNPSHEASLQKGKIFLERIADTYCSIGRQGLVVIPGNHDYRWFGNIEFASGRDSFQEILKDYTGHKLFRFDLGDVAVACLDSNNGAKLDWARGQVNLNDLNLFDKALWELKPGRNGATSTFHSLIKIALVHHHPLPVPAADRTAPHLFEKLFGKPISGGAEYMLMRNAGAFLSKLLQLDFRLVLHGHLHEKGYWRVIAQDENRKEKWLEVIGGASLRNGKEVGFNLVDLDVGGFLKVSNHSWNQEGVPGNPLELPSAPYEVIRMLRQAEHQPREAESRLYSQFWTVDLGSGNLESVEIIKGYRALKDPVSSMKILMTSAPLVSTVFRAKQIGGDEDQVVSEIPPEPDPNEPDTLNYYIQFQPPLTTKSSCDFVCKYLHRGVMFRSLNDQIGFKPEAEKGWDSITQQVIRATDQMVIKLRFIPDKCASEPWVPEKVAFEVRDERGRLCESERKNCHVVFEHMNPRLLEEGWLDHQAYNAMVAVYKPRIDYTYCLKWQLPPSERIKNEIDVQRWQDLLFKISADEALRIKGQSFLSRCIEIFGDHRAAFTNDSSDVSVVLFAYDRRTHMLSPQVSRLPDRAPDLQQTLQYGHDVVGTAFRLRKYQAFRKHPGNFEFLRKLQKSKLHYLLALPLWYPADSGWPIGVIAFASLNDTSRLHEFCNLDEAALNELNRSVSQELVQILGS
jgi:hypothetical protein